MPNIKRVSPLEARQLIDEGYTYVDVRTVEEFHARHPAGALNVPLDVVPRSGSAGSTEDFLSAMRRFFAPDAKIVVGCATGVRSLHAAELLLEADFLHVVDQRAGTDGVRTAFGAVLERGWVAEGLPIATGPDAGSYDVVRSRSAPR